MEKLVVVNNLKFTTRDQPISKVNELFEEGFRFKDWIKIDNANILILIEKIEK